MHIPSDDLRDEGALGRDILGVDLQVWWGIAPLLKRMGEVSACRER